MKRKRRQKGEMSGNEIAAMVVFIVLAFVFIISTISLYTEKQELTEQLRLKSDVIDQYELRIKKLKTAGVNWNIVQTNKEKTEEKKEEPRNLERYLEECYYKTKIDENVALIPILEGYPPYIEKDEIAVNILAGFQKKTGAQITAWSMNEKQDKLYVTFFKPK